MGQEPERRRRREEDEAGMTGTEGEGCGPSSRTHSPPTRHWCWLGRTLEAVATARSTKMNSAYTMTNTMMVTSTFSSSKKSRSFFRVVTCHRQCQHAVNLCHSPCGRRPVWPPPTAQSV